MKAGLWSRVSTDDKGQDPELQLGRLRVAARADGHDVAVEYAVHESGRQGRPVKLEGMLRDATNRAFDVLYATATDRLTRRGPREVFRVVAHLEKCGIPIKILDEPFLNTDSPFKDVLLAVMGWAAKWVGDSTAARVKAGLERARANGVKLGRFEVQLPLDELARLKAEGRSLRQICQAITVPIRKNGKLGHPSVGTVRKWLSKLGTERQGVTAGLAPVQESGD